MKLGKCGLRWWDGGVVGEGLDSPRGGRVNRTRLHRSHLLWLSEKLVRQGFKITKLRSAGGNWVTGSFGEKSKLTELKSKRFPHWPEPVFGIVCAHSLSSEVVSSLCDRGLIGPASPHTKPPLSPATLTVLRAAQTSFLFSTLHYWTMKSKRSLINPGPHACGSRASHSWEGTQSQGAHECVTTERHGSLNRQYFYYSVNSIYIIGKLDKKKIPSAAQQRLAYYPRPTWDNAGRTAPNAPSLIIWWIPSYARKQEFEKQSLPKKLWIEREMM